MVPILFAGCSKPNAANIAVRKQNQDLQAQIERLERAHQADAATIRSLQQSKGTLPTLPQDRIDRLFTTHGLKFGRLTGGVRMKPGPGSDDAISIHIVPVDGAGEAIKASGSFEIDAFDLSEPQSPRVGHWEFRTDQARKNWFGEAMLYNYVLACPLEAPAKHDELTVRVTFTDELTQRQFMAQKIVRMSLTSPSTNSPTTAPINSSPTIASP